MNPCDDLQVLRAARRLIRDGQYPTGNAVAASIDYRWASSTVRLALMRLIDSRRLVIPPYIRPSNHQLAGIQFDDDLSAIAARRVEIYEARRREPKPRAAEPSITEWLAKQYWTPERRRLYRRVGT